MTQVAPGVEGKKAEPEQGGAAGPGAPGGGSYEVIRRRLLERAGELARRAESLNAKRKEVFGASEMALLANPRIRTEQNCVPRDIVSIRGRLLVGYQVVLGLKAEAKVSDLFTLHAFKRGAGQGEAGFEVTDIPLAVEPPHEPSEEARFLLDATFAKELRDTYRYFKGAQLLHLRRTETRLLAAFQVGATPRDKKVFRWAIDAARRLTYLDSRGDDDDRRPPSHDFQWTATGRDDHVAGRHPHVAILDQVFVETVGGDLTIKIENNTQTGQGIYREAVDDQNQTLDDAEIAYARVGALILLKIKPFRESVTRYLVYNPVLREVRRFDSIGAACLALPEDQGVVFPDGYYLVTGETKRFDLSSSGDVEFERVVRSPNGEDALYVFHHVASGLYVLLPYNLIKKEVASPITCHGYSLFDDGTMVIFRAQEEASRIHPLQIWRTPFFTAEHAASAPTDGSYLAKVGNAELVRGISDAFSLRKLCFVETPRRSTFEDVVRAASRMVDAYYWLSSEEAFDLGRPCASW